MACSVCGSSNQNQIIDFGSVPLCDDIKADKISAINVQSFPITILNCEECSHSELLVKPPEELIYSNYTYRTSLAPSLDSHFKKVSEIISAAYQKYIRSGRPACFVDIGGNDGVLAGYMKDKGFNSFIIDPSPTARFCKTGTVLYNQYFDTSAVELFIAENGQADIIACNNCMANIRNLEDFAANISRLLVEGGLVFVETGYLVGQMKSGAAEMINHEHYHYFTIESISRLFSKFGISAVSYDILPTKGGSFRFVGRKSADKDEITKSFPNEHLDYISFNARCSSRKTQLAEILSSRRTDFFGASAGSTILTYLLGLSEYIDCIVDDNVTRHGLFMPGSGARIVSPDEWYAKHGKCCINMAWRFGDMIRKRHIQFLPMCYEIIDAM